MPLLLIEKGRDRGKSFTIEAEGVCLVGREPVCQLRLHDPMTSRRHFRIQGDGTRYQIQDLGSSNGTYLNGKKVMEDFIQVEDKVQVGETIISLLRDSGARRKGPLTGKAIGGYLFQERVGRGGMGTVYRARQISLDRAVAVKVLSPELTKNERFVDLFIREARAAGKLAHPNVVEVYDVVGEEGIFFYSMELVEGGSVDALISDQGPLAPRRALEIVRDAAKALQYAEQKRVIHRDVKPDNLMITSGGSIKICDLGIAKTLGEQGTAPQAEGISGSPHYMAPEQGTGQAIDHRADIYSLGVSLYEMLAGTTPFTGSSHAELIGKHLREEPPSVREHRGEIPKPVARLVERMMAKRPDDRFEKAADLADESSRLIATLKGDEARAAAGAPPRRFRLARLAALGMFAALVFGPSIIWSRDRRTRAAEENAFMHGIWREEDMNKGRNLYDQFRFSEAAVLVERVSRSSDTEEARSASEFLAHILEAKRGTEESDKALQEALVYAKAQPKDLRGFERRLSEIQARHAGNYPYELKIWRKIDPYLKKVRETLQKKEAKIRLEGRKLDEERRERKILAAAVSEVEGFCDNGQYRDAFSRIDTFREEHPGLGDEADILERKVRNVAEDAYLSAESEAGRLRRAGKLQEAAALMRGMESSVPIDEIRAKALALAEEIEKEDRDRQSREQAERDKSDRIRFDKSVDAARQKWNVFQIQEAMEILEDGKGSLSGTAFRQNYDWKIAHLGRVQGVLDRIRRYAEGDGKPLLLQSRGQNWDILEAGEEGLTIRIRGSGEATTLMPWDKLPEPQWKKIRSICRQIGNALSARDRLNLYTFCLQYQKYGDQFAKTEKDEAEALLEKKDDPEVRKALLDYEERRW